MAKLILSMDGLVLKEIPLTKERTTIGRKPHNDIQIDNLAVSGEHAVIVTILNDSFLEDLGSTNGTVVNGNPVKKHFLQNNDVVELGKYKLKFVGDAGARRRRGEKADFEKTMVLRPSQMKAAAEQAKAGAGSRRAGAQAAVAQRAAAVQPVGATATAAGIADKDAASRAACASARARRARRAGRRRPLRSAAPASEPASRWARSSCSRAPMPARSSSSPSPSPRSASPACRLRCSRGARRATSSPTSRAPTARRSTASRSAPRRMRSRTTT